MSFNESKAAFLKRSGIQPQVFGFSIVVILLAIILTLLNLHAAQRIFPAIEAEISSLFGWLFIFSMQGFLLFCFYLAASRFGHIRLGGPDARPDYSAGTWFSMLFAAGMGIGIIFWGVAEPVRHLQNPPGAEGLTSAGAIRAMDLTFLHWGFHAWGVYTLVGLALAYFSFNRGLPLTIRSAFYPLFGDRIYGSLGHIIDITAVVATIFGVATSMGLGVAQINAGLHYLFGITISTGVQVALIVLITGAATVSVVTGLDRGIKFLSQFNVIAALILLLFMLFVGPTLFLLKSFVQDTGHYLQNLVVLGSWSGAYSHHSKWLGKWTVFYWAWWVAWSPFVSMFIARVSRGRTVREFILGVLVVPSVLTFLWLTVFGGTAIFNILHGDNSVLNAVNSNIATALFELLRSYPLAKISTILGMILVAVFFVTSADSSALVAGIIGVGGKLEVAAPQRAFWAVAEGVVAAVLMVGGGISALRAASLSSGLPFLIILIIMAYCLFRAFQEDMPPDKYTGTGK